ncbi:MAG: TIGR00341 family protein, partial [Thiolinea sp.]
MKYVEVVANQGSSDTVAAIAEKVKASDFRLGMVGEDGMQAMRLLVTDNQVQNLLDLLENVLGAQPTARIMVLPVEVSLPRLGVDQEKQQDSAISLREALYQEVAKGARLDMNYIALLMLSTVVAAIGMIENNVAVVIGAMVIAPLLTPNLALSLGTALGDVSLMRKSALTLLVGIGLAVLMSAVLGAWWPNELNSPELLARTHAGWSAVALALASGAAAALSLTTGLSSV